MKTSPETIAKLRELLAKETLSRVDHAHIALALPALLDDLEEANREIDRRKEELKLALCTNPRDPEHGGHCETCSGLSVARTRRLYELETDNTRLTAERDTLRAEIEALKEVNRLRAEGWSVAIHNDYTLKGEWFTFWLFTKGSMCVKGEARTDGAALAQVRIAVNALREAEK